MNNTGSCPCNSCPKKQGSIQPRYLNNLGVPNCEYPESFDCVNRISWACKMNPALSNEGIDDKIINPNFGLVSAPEFYKVGGGGGGDCVSEGYTADWDNRLYDPRRNLHMVLDKAPLQARNRGTYNNPDVYVSEYDAIKPQVYGDYSKINNGQIQYYHDTTIDDPYFSPNFVRRYSVDYVLFKDPMGSIKPEYIRNPLNFTNNNFSKDSFMRDSTLHREDIMERQMRVRNQQRYEPRYYSA